MASLLFKAVSAGDFDEVVGLVERGEDVNATDEDGNTPLHIAVLRKNERIACFLVEHDAELYADNHEGKNPLVCAPAKLRGMMKATKEIKDLYRRMENKIQGREVS